MSRARPEEAAAVAGIVLVAIGALGFVPEVTTNWGDLAFAGSDSRAELLGVFRVSILLNLLHVGAGAVGLVLARSEPGARRFLGGGGTGFLLLWLLGVAKAGDWIPLDTADNWLHLGFGAGLIGVGYVTAQAPSGRPG
jgi:hypothetical protein